MDDLRERNISDPRDLFVQSLLTKKQEIEKVIEGLKEDRKVSEEHRSSDNFLEDLDRAYNEISTQQHYIFLERKYSELKKIEALINKVSKYEDFGWCEECGDRINMERLSVMPDATMCISCQREHEKTEYRKGLTAKEYKRPKDDGEFEDENIREGQELKAFIGNIDNGPISIADLEVMDLTDDFSQQNGHASSSINDLS